MTDAKTPTAREIAEKIAYDEYESWTEQIYTDTIVYNGRLADLIEQAIIQARAQALEEAAAAIRALKGAVTMGDQT